MIHMTRRWWPRFNQPLDAREWLLATWEMTRWDRAHGIQDGGQANDNQETDGENPGD